MEKEKLLPECLQQTNTGDGGEVGIWSCISDFGTTTANVYTENINGQLYCDVLETELKRSMARFPKKTKMFYQQDVAPWDTSNIVKDKIAKLKVNVLDWAPKTRDLNPIEKLWSILDKNLTSKPIYLRTALMERLEEEWDNNIDEELWIKLVESMPEQIQRCIKGKGEHFL